MSPRATQVDHLIADVFAAMEAKYLRVVSLRVNPADLALLTTSDQYHDGWFWGARVNEDVTVTKGTVRVAGENVKTGRVEADEVYPLRPSD